MAGSVGVVSPTRLFMHEVHLASPAAGEASKPKRPPPLRIRIPTLEPVVYATNREVVKLSSEHMLSVAHLVPGRLTKYKIPKMHALMKVEVEKVLQARKDNILGEGSGGVVYPFTFEGKKYAFKILKPGFEDASTLNREFKFSHLLNPHPNLMTVLFSTNVNVLEPFAYRSPCIVMEYLPGAPLIDHLLKECSDAEGYCIVENESLLLKMWKEGDLDAGKELASRIANIRSLVKDITSALKHLHGQGVLHRDVKPENIMLVRDSTFGKKHILFDYGHSRDPSTASGIPNRFIHSESTPERRPLTPCGTETYMSPEIHLTSAMTGKTYGYASDIWALGTLIYAAAVSGFPYDIKSAVEYAGNFEVEKIKKGPPIMPSGLPPQLVDLLNKCFEGDPKERISLDAILKHPFLTSPDRVLKDFQFEVDKK